jgi:hypothetical protein
VQNRTRFSLSIDGVAYLGANGAREFVATLQRHRLA